MKARQALLICVMSFISNPTAAIQQETQPPTGREHQVSLFGYNTPSLDQRCTNAAGHCYDCGKKAAAHFAHSTMGKELTCHFLAAGNNAICYSGGRDVGWQIIRDGWALADRQRLQEFPEIDSLYREAEELARRDKLGLWQGDFIPPDRWRAGRRLDGCE